MLSKIPIFLDKVNQEDLNKEILRAAIVAELDAISLYEQMADLTDNDEVRRVLLDVAKEEKTHVGEFQTLLLEQDEEQVRELGAGKKEVEEELRKLGGE
jgi:rubrerythrin